METSNFMEMKSFREGEYYFLEGYPKECTSIYSRTITIPFTSLHEPKKGGSIVVLHNLESKENSWIEQKSYLKISPKEVRVKVKDTIAGRIRRASDNLGICVYDGKFNLIAIIYPSIIASSRLEIINQILIDIDKEDSCAIERDLSENYFNIEV